MWLNQEIGADWKGYEDLAKLLRVWKCKAFLIKILWLSFHKILEYAYTDKKFSQSLIDLTERIIG